MATVLRQEHGRSVVEEGRALGAWLSPCVIYKGKLHTMERKLEPELMDDDAQAKAYAQADFDDPHSSFVLLFKRAFAGRDIKGYVVDLGCGPGDITFRFASAYPDCTVHGVDGSEAMLKYGRQELASHPDILDRVELIQGILPGARLPREQYDVIISNSLLHHLRDPQALWSVTMHLGVPGAPVFIMDLHRPDSPEAVRKLVDRHMGKEPAILRRDFYNSLLAAFRVEEIHSQLERAGIRGFEVEKVGDRHVTISGNLP